MTQYTLKLSFDLRQVTPSLAYEFVLEDNMGYPMVDGGPLAGTFNFQKGDEIFVEVVATSAATDKPPKTSSKDILQSFGVTSCIFISVPARMTELLSMFDATNACAMVSEWGPIQNISNAEDEKNNIQRLNRRSLSALPVVTKNGQWQISGYLSVELTSDDNKTHGQLYFFDPEGSTGTGGGEDP